MPTKVEVTRQQYGVGQGCFHVQDILINDGTREGSYRFVYDCESSSGMDDLKWCIKHATSKGSQKIDAVYVSHFEDDHVNGLSLLTKRATVGRIFLPHLTDLAALHILAKAVSNAASLTPQLGVFSGRC